MAKRRDNRESWIRSEPNVGGYYEASVWMGLKPNGRPDRRHVQRKHLKDVKARVKELERERDAGTASGPGRLPTVEQMMERHLAVTLVTAGRAPRTIDDYRSKCRNDIFPRWGGQRIDRLTPEHIEDGLAEMLAAGHAPSHVRKVYAILSSAYALQVRRGRVARNPCAAVPPPALAEAELAGLSEAEALAVIQAALERPDAARWITGLVCGMRQGEVLGLRWPYVDLEAAELRAWWQLQRLTWRHGCADPAACGEGHHKTQPCRPGCKAHTRSCPLPCPPGCAEHARHCPQRKDGGLVFREIKERRRKTVLIEQGGWLVSVLKEHRDAQYLQALAAGADWEDHGLVFCQWNGRPVSPRQDWQEWKGLLAAAGLPPYRLHAMRHSAASFHAAERVNEAVIGQVLGHADGRTTRRYVHVGETARREATGRVERRLQRGTATKTATANTGE